MSQKEVVLKDENTGVTDLILKRHAKIIKKEREAVQHAAALDEAAQLRGYDNYAHFTKIAKGWI